MYFATADCSIMLAEIKKFDRTEDAEKYASDNDGIVIPEEVAVEIIGLSYSDNGERIDDEFQFYAVEDGRADQIDIECFATEEDRDNWCNSSDVICFPISGRFAKALINNYTYSEDPCFDRYGVSFLR